MVSEISFLCFGIDLGFFLKKLCYGQFGHFRGVLPVMSNRMHITRQNKKQLETIKIQFSLKVQGHF